MTLPISDAWDEPEWVRASRAADVEHAENARADRAERDACESVEAEETRWVGIRAARPDWYGRIHYERDVPDRDDAVERTPL